MSLLQRLYDNLTSAEELVANEIDIRIEENRHLNNLPTLARTIAKMQIIIEGSQEPEE